MRSPTGSAWCSCSSTWSTSKPTRPTGRTEASTDEAGGSGAAAAVDHRLRIEAPVWAIPGARSLAHRIASEAKTGARLGKASLRTATDLLRDPRGTIEQLGRTTGSIARVVKPATTPLSPAMTERSLNTHFEAIAVPFGALKASARSVDATLNDAFVAITLDALKRYHDAIGHPCSAVRMNMPISVRGGEGSNNFDNQFVPARMVLPLSDADPAERIGEVQQLLREVRAEPALPHVNDISGVISRFGPAAAVSILGAMLKGVDITTSNVPGPPFPVFMAGARVEEFYAFGPLAGAAINITLFSYDGTVHLGVNSDRAAVDDLALLDAMPARRHRRHPRAEPGRVTLRDRVLPPDPRGVGDEPDYRFTLANERTFLAWIRTALALAAGGLAAVSLLDDVALGETLGILLLALSFVTAASAYRRWALNERSMRLNEPLPTSRLPMLMAIGTAIVAIVAAVILVVDRA